MRFALTQISLDVARRTSLDTSFSFGTVRSVTSALIEQVELQLDELSSSGESFVFIQVCVSSDEDLCDFNFIFVFTELRRFPTFAGACHSFLKYMVTCDTSYAY